MKTESSVQKSLRDEGMQMIQVEEYRHEKREIEWKRLLEKYEGGKKVRDQIRCWNT